MADTDELYETDFYAWTRREVRNLKALARERPNLPLDLRHIIEEIDDLGSDRRHAVESLTTLIIEHLLLLQHAIMPQPRAHWVQDVLAFRDQLDRRMTKALRGGLERRLPRLYAGALRRVRTKLRMSGEPAAAAGLPADCAYTLDQIIGDWFPAGVED